MYAIVATGGKQYKVETGDIIEVEKLEVSPQGSLALDVVFVADGSGITTDAVALAKAKVYAEVVEHFKGDKALIFKFKKRKGYKRLRGHRQPLTRLEIISIALDGVAPKPKKKPDTKADSKADKVEKSESTQKSIKTDKTDLASVKEPAKKKESVSKKETVSKKTSTGKDEPVEKKKAASKKESAVPKEIASEEEPAAKDKPVSKQESAGEADSSEEK